MRGQEGREEDARERERGEKGTRPGSCRGPGGEHADPDVARPRAGQVEGWGFLCMGSGEPEKAFDHQSPQGIMVP